MSKFGTRPDLTRQARASIEAGQPRDAMKLLQAAIDASLGDAEAWALLAVCHGMLGEYIECERSCRRVVELEPRAYGSWGNLANALTYQGRVAEAEKAYRKALKIEPRYAEGHYNLGNLLLERKEFAAAERCYRQAITLQPRYPDALANLAAALQAQMKNEEAVVCCQRVLALQPRHVSSLSNLGSVLIVQGKMAEAIQVFERLIAFLPENVKDWWSLANIFHQIHVFNRAIECCQRALSIDPGHALSCFTMAHCYTATKDYNKAEEMFRKALALDPVGMEKVHFYLAAIGREPLPEKMPQSQVKELFDYYAVGFDRHLQEVLAYRTPQLLSAVVSSVMTASSTQLDILDLGCGTGLSGEPFRDIARRLTGVDLSPNMIAKAKARGIYDELIVDDILATLVRTDAAFDLIIAIDVFIYFGELASVFRACKSALRSGGLFAFSTEVEEGEDEFVLRPSGRYAHTLSYLRTLADTSGFIIVATERVILRKESKKDVEGNLCVLRHKIV